jgi:flagellar biosynthesis/type III secretory pathway protein FliH
MAAIIRAPVLSAVGRQLRRPGAAAPALPAVPDSHVTPPTTMTAAPAQAEAPAALAQTAMQAVPPAPAVQAAVPEEAALLARAGALQEQARQLEQREQALAAAQAELTRQREELARGEQQLQAAQRQLDDDAAGIRADAEQRGHAQGVEQGVEQGQREAQEAAAVQTDRLNVLLHALHQTRRTLLDDNEDMLVEISFAAICRLLGRQAATRATLAAMVRGLVEGEREPATLTVRLHPQDAQQLEGGVDGLDPHLRFQADASIELGGCVIDSPRGTLDARLELQLQHLREALTAARRQQQQQEVPV